MASRRSAIAKAWSSAQAHDLRTLPHEARLDRPGAYGTNAQRTRGSVPLAPTLDAGPLYTGEDREEIDGDELVVPLTDARGGDPNPFVILATTRRPWPWIAFSLDTSHVAALTTLRAGVVIHTRSGLVRLTANVFAGVVPEIVQAGRAAPFPWIQMSGIYVGARVSIFATQTYGGEGTPPEVIARANLLGYNAPGFGP